jgi:hypothetical protein
MARKKGLRVIQVSVKFEIFIIIISLKYANIVTPLVLALTFINYTYSFYYCEKRKKRRNKLDKLLFLDTYNGEECNLIFRIIFHEKYFYKGQDIIILMYI